MNPPIHLPIVTIQPDFEQVISDINSGLVPNESFWISCYKSGETTVHGKVHATLDERDRNLVRFEGQGGVDFKSAHDRVYTAACSGMRIEHTRTVLPTKSYADPLPLNASGQRRKIAAFDVAPDGSQFAAGYDDGLVYIVPTASSNPSVCTTSKAHLNSVTSLRFFPSSRALLTAGVDFSLSILSAEVPSPSPNSSGPTASRIDPVRTFKGHSRAVTSGAIISRGRNVLSSSKDGTVRLWDVPSGTQIRSLGVAGFIPALAMSVGERGEGAFSQPPDGEEGAKPTPFDEREVETAEKVVFCALNDGTFQAFDLGTKQSIFHSAAQRGSSALCSIAYAPSSSLVATGSNAGIINVYDTRSLGTPLTSFSRNGASVEELTFVSSSFGNKEPGLAVATEDGLPYVVGVRPEGPAVQAELVGTDCDAARCIRVGGSDGEVWTASDDGIVRKYEGLNM
ncbi:hypothetical protein EUX98_g7041 [Antrodiella citrinella]|uniref:Uncharacterized protein n=1 Tax=Antrodiella citrinella TaxID=2447956 RepID=A0A4S4MMJ1_9APHY|nr:hypothetical protein EUX98_g7041 [Antrodiella citrinella]